MLTHLIVLSALVLQTTAFDIKGEIKFGNVIPSIINKSLLVVEVQDTSQSDASAITLKKVEIAIDRFDGSKLEYYIKDIPNPETSTKNLTLSVVIRNGWQEPIEGEWIRPGDYLNDTIHEFTYIDGKNFYQKDVNVIHYQN